jgi:hypothetical protein
VAEVSLPAIIEGWPHMSAIAPRGGAALLTLMAIGNSYSTQPSSFILRLS